MKARATTTGQSLRLLPALFSIFLVSHPASLPAAASAIFPHFAVGPANTTLFTLLNSGDTPLTGTLILTARDGRPANLRLSSGSTQSTGASVEVSIAPAGVQFVTAAPVDAGDLATITGWARVESSGGVLGGVCTFQYAPGGNLQSVAGVLASEPLSSATIALDDAAPGRATGYAVANPSTVETITIQVQAVNADGSPGPVLAPVELGPGEQKASFVYEDPLAGSVFRGSVVLVSRDGKVFAAVALVLNQGLFTAIPVVPALAPVTN